MVRISLLHFIVILCVIVFLEIFIELHSNKLRIKHKKKKNVIELFKQKIISNFDRNMKLKFIAFLHEIGDKIAYDQFLRSDSFKITLFIF